jgi:putative DNA methylase
VEKGTEDGRGETVIAWLWARTVKSPNPAVDAHVPLVRSFILSKKKGRECWAKPVVEAVNPSPRQWERGLGGEGHPTHTIRFEVTLGKPPAGRDGTVTRTGGRCIVSGEPIPFEYIRAEGKAGRMGAMLMAIVTEGENGRNYYSPDEWHARVAASAQPEWIPAGDIPEQALSFSVQLYGMDEYNKLFTPRQLVALTTFTDLVAEARQQVYADARAAGLPDDGIPLRAGGRGALAYAEAVSVYLGMNVSKQANRTSNINFWDAKGENVQQVFARQAIAMTWDFTEGNPFSDSSGNFLGQLEYVTKVVESLPTNSQGFAAQQDASQLNQSICILSTDPPYYDNIGYADLSDFFYVWLRRSLRGVYPDLFSTLLVPKDAELIASPHRHGSKAAAKQHFERGMLQTFTNIRRFASPDYPLTVYYAYKQQEAEDAEESPTPDPSPKLKEGEQAAASLSPLVGERDGDRGSPSWGTPLPPAWGRGRGWGHPPAGRPCSPA